MGFFQNKNRKSQRDTAVNKNISSVDLTDRDTGKASYTSIYKHLTIKFASEDQLAFRSKNRASMDTWHEWTAMFMKLNQDSRFKTEIHMTSGPFLSPVLAAKPKQALITWSIGL